MGVSTLNKCGGNHLADVGLLLSGVLALLAFFVGECELGA